MNYSGNSLNRTLPSAAAGAHVKAPHFNAQYVRRFKFKSRHN